jgi:hypothetical protein
MSAEKSYWAVRVRVRRIATLGNCWMLLLCKWSRPRLSTYQYGTLQYFQEIAAEKKKKFWNRFAVWACTACVLDLVKHPEPIELDLPKKRGNFLVRDSTGCC